MNAIISVIGCGRTGIQTGVLLLERFSGTINVHDKDTEFVKGMVLDCMQASSVWKYRAPIRAVDSVEPLKKSNVVIISEHRDEESITAATLEDIASAAVLCLYAGQDASILKSAKSANVFGVHGIADAAVLRREVSRVIDIAAEDISVMVSGGAGTAVESKPEWVRVCGIPINDVQPNAYEASLERARKTVSGFDGGSWKPHYAFAAAAAEAALCAVSGQSAVFPVTTGQGTVPAIVSSTGYKELTQSRHCGQC